MPTPMQDELAARRHQTLIDKQRKVAEAAIDQAKDEWEKLANLEQTATPDHTERPFN